MSNPVKIKAELMWPNLDIRNELSGKYQINLSKLSPAAVQALNDMGIETHSKEDQGEYITCKSNNPIKAYDTDNNEIDGVLVGNGSKAIAVVSFYNWKFKNKEGVSPSLKKLVITDLVRYEAGDIASVDDDDDVL